MGSNFPVWCVSRVKTRLSAKTSDGRTGVETPIFSHKRIKAHARRHLATTTITFCQRLARQYDDPGEESRLRTEFTTLSSPASRPNPFQPPNTQILLEPRRVCRRAGETSAVVNVGCNQRRVGVPKGVRTVIRGVRCTNYDDLLSHESRRVSAA